MPNESLPQPRETSQPAQQPLEERGGVMEVVDQVSTVLGGVGGVAGTAYVVKHWKRLSRSPWKFAVAVPV